MYAGSWPYGPSLQGAGVLLHPIPFPDPDRLVALYQKTPRDQKNAVSYPNLLDWQRRTRAFEEIAGVRNASFTLTGVGDPEQLMGLAVSSNLFSVLRTQPLLGRMFTQEEDQRGGHPVVLLDPLGGHEVHKTVKFHAATKFA